MGGITTEEALCLVLQHTPVIQEKEQIQIANISGRVLAEDVKTVFDNPPFHRSPIDGYACRAADLTGASKEQPVCLKVLREIDAGDYSEEEVQPGQAVRIMTGAAIPPGCDCCVRQEDTDYGEERVQIYKAERPWGNYCFKGEDFKAGQVLLKAGRELGFVEAGVLAGMGVPKVSVYRRPRIAVLTTGNEVVQPGEPLAPGKIYDINQKLLAARLLELGVELCEARSVPDEPEQMAEALKKAAKEADLIVTTGAVSVGKKDIMHESLALIGAERVFWGIQVKPGMPTLFSDYQGIPVMSLSGNPFSALVITELLLRPMLAKMMRKPSLDLVRVQGTLADAFGKPSPSRRFVRAYWEKGTFHLPEGLNSNGVLASMVGCNCLLDVPAGSGTLKPGDPAEAILL